MEHLESSDTEAADWLLRGLVAAATGSQFDGGPQAYAHLRQQLKNNPTLSQVIPPIVNKVRRLDYFWEEINFLPTYAERRKFLRSEFESLFSVLEATDNNPTISNAQNTLEAFSPTELPNLLAKAVARQKSDPEGAITAARSFLESTCKYVLEDQSISYSERTDLPKLWALASEGLNLAPSQHEEQAFKTILGNCHSVVNTLAEIRNKVGDSHGKGRRYIKPKPRHAALVVGLASAMAQFLIATHSEKEH